MNLYLFSIGAVHGPFFAVNKTLSQKLIAVLLFQLINAPRKADIIDSNFLPKAQLDADVLTSILHGRLQ